MSIGDITPRDAWKTFPRMALYHVTDQLAHQAATSPHNDLPQPTPEQKESGDYVKGHVTIAGLPIAIENPQWSTRSGVDADGKEWSVTMRTHYGYVEDSLGADGDEVDVILMPRTEPDFAGDVYVITQNEPQTGRFDEHKVVVGAVDADQAIEAYHANYSDDWQGFGGIDTMSMDEFKEWLSLPPDGMIFDSLGQGIGAITDQDVQNDPLGVLGVCLGVLEARQNDQNIKYLSSKILADQNLLQQVRVNKKDSLADYWLGTKSPIFDIILKDIYSLDADFVNRIFNDASFKKTFINKLIDYIIPTLPSADDVPFFQDAKQIIDSPSIQTDGLLPFPWDEVNQSFYHSTRNSEATTNGFNQRYIDIVRGAMEKARPHVETVEQQVAFDQASSDLQAQFISKIKRLAASRSGVYSGFMAGGSKLNTRQVEQRGNSYDRTAIEIEKWMDNTAPNFIYDAVRSAMNNEQRQLERQQQQDAADAVVDQAAMDLWGLLISTLPTKFAGNEVKAIGFSRDGLPSSLTIGGGWDPIKFTSLYKNKPYSVETLVNRLKAKGFDVPTKASQIKKASSEKSTPKAAYNPDYKTITMDEWKRKPRDYKSIKDGQRYIFEINEIGGSGLIPVNVVKSLAAFDSIGSELEGITDQDIEDDPLGVLRRCLSALPDQKTKNIGTQLTQDQAIANLEWLDTADPVASMEGDEVPRFDKLKILAEWVGEYWSEKTGGVVSRSDLGNIVIDTKAAKYSTNHGMSATKAKAFYLVPDAIKDGVLLGKLPDTKGKPTAFIIAAPVAIAGKSYRLLMEVRSDANMQRLYVHEVVLRDGKSPLQSFKSGADSEKEQPSAPARGDIYNFMLNLRKIQSEKIVNPTSTEITPTGRDNTVKTAKGTKVGTKFMVIEADQLITSHDASGNTNPLFPQELQPRDRSRETSQAWVQKVAASLDAESLGRTGRADSGAPIIGSDRVVESGNGRSMAIQLAYARGTAEEYRQFIIDDAEYFGLDPDAIEAMNQPVLVRVRTTAIDRQVFTVEANQDDKLTFSATERARSDAKRLDANLIAQFAPGEDGDLLIAANQRFIQGFLKSLGDTESAQYMTTEGKPTKALVDRIKAAVFSKAYNDDRLLEMMADDTKPEIQNVLNALGAAAPRFIEAQAYGRIATKTLSEQVVDSIEQSLDQRVVDAVVNATNVLLASRAVGQDITEYVRQQGLFEDIDEGVAALAVFLAKNGRSAKRMGIAFKAMAEFVKNDAIDQTNNGLFGEPVPPSMMDVVAAANRQLELVYGDDQGNNIGLFDSLFEQDGLIFLNQQDLDKYQHNKIRARTPRGYFSVPVIRQTLLRIEGFDSNGADLTYSAGLYGVFVVSFERDAQNMLIIIKRPDGEYVCGWPITEQDSTSMLVRRVIDVLGVPITDVVETMFDSLDQPIDFTDSWFDGCIVRWSGQAQSEQAMPLPSPMEIGSMVTIGLYDKGVAVEMMGQIRAIKFRAGKVRYEVALPIMHTCFASVIEVNSESVVGSRPNDAPSHEMQG